MNKEEILVKLEHLYNYNLYYKKYNIKDSIIDTVTILSTSVDMTVDFIYLEKEVKKSGLLVSNGLYKYLYSKYPYQLVDALETVKIKNKLKSQP